MRPICTKCNQKPRAISYHKNNKVYYRKICESCLWEKKKKTIKEPLWKRAGYRKKATCEKCGFKPTIREQLVIFYIDGNMKNINTNNLKTVCLNCNYELGITGWIIGDLVED